jgi:hypothetical protein
VGVDMSGVLCATGAVCGASQPSFENERAIAVFASSPYDCQANAAAAPMQNMIEPRASGTRLPCLGRSLWNWSFFRAAGSIAS